MKRSSSQPDLRVMALTASSAYRTKKINVTEWNGVTVTLREPSAEAWLKFREIVSPEIPEDEERPKLTVAQTFLRNKEADIVLFVDVLLDEDGSTVFSDEDRTILSDIYGPVHARLLKEAIDLGITQETAEAK